MARIPSTEADVLTAVVTRLRAQVSGFNASTCVVAEETEPEPQFQDSIQCLVSPMGGEFDQGGLAGGGAALCHETGGVIVSVWSQIRLDPRDRATEKFLNASRGLTVLKKAVLKALTCHDLLDGSGNQILSEPMRPIRSEYLRIGGRDDRYAGFSIMFQTELHWDLS